MKLRTLLYCLLGGLPLSVAALGAGHLGWFYLSGIVLAAAFVPIALFGPRSILGQFGAIAPVLLIVTTLCTWSEGLIFVPSMRAHAFRDLFAEVVIYLVMAVVLTVLARVLRLGQPTEMPHAHRSFAATAVLILASGIAYALYYLVFGALTYQFFTKVYYPNANELVGPLGLWFWAIQIARGVLMTLAVLPAIVTLRMKRWQAAIAVGVLVWVAGGAAPLLPPNPFMVTTQRFIHIVEIFTQNFSLGMTAVWLLRPRAPRVEAASPVQVAA